MSVTIPTLATEDKMDIRHQHDRHQNNKTRVSEAERKNQILEKLIKQTESVTAKRMRADHRSGNYWNERDW